LADKGQNLYNDRFWPLADIDLCNANVRFRGKADISFSG
jgi:hypothetical protein